MDGEDEIITVPMLVKTPDGKTVEFNVQVVVEGEEASLGPLGDLFNSLWFGEEPQWPPALEKYTFDFDREDISFFLELKNGTQQTLNHEYNIVDELLENYKTNPMVLTITDKEDTEETDPNTTSCSTCTMLTKTEQRRLYNKTKQLHHKNIQTLGGLGFLVLSQRIGAVAVPRDRAAKPIYHSFRW
eukprot:2473675-Amphidinium_carterae.1